MIAFDEELLRAGVGVVEQQNAVGGEPVSPCASDLLIVSFDRSWKVIVNDESNVALVDPHPESVGCHDALDTSGHEAVLSAGTFMLAHPSVIGFDAETGHFEFRSNLLDTLAG